VQFSALFKGKLRATIAMVVICFLFSTTIFLDEKTGDLDEFENCIGYIFDAAEIEQVAMTKTYFLLK
jgi:hypothetical protein